MLDSMRSRNISERPINQFITQAIRGIKRRLRPVDKPCWEMHRDVLNALLPPHGTNRVERDYWEKRGSSEKSNQEVLWLDPDFQAVEGKHITYLWGLCRGKAVLDVGAGWGRFGVKLRGSYQAYTGLEQSNSMIARGPKNIKLVHGSAINMPFRIESFDVAFMVICLSSVHRNVFAIYNEAMRCLKPGGVFVILESDISVVFEKPTP